MLCVGRGLMLPSCSLSGDSVAVDASSYCRFTLTSVRSTCSCFLRGASGSGQGLCRCKSGRKQE